MGNLFVCPVGFLEFFTSCSFEDMFDCMPKILSVTCPKPRHFWGNLIVRPLGFPKTIPCTKLGSLPHVVLKTFLILCQNFEGSRYLGHAPFGENYLCTRSGFPRRSCVPNLKSLAQVVLKICSIVFRKFNGSRYLGDAPFGENYLSARTSFPRRSCVPNLKSLAQIVLKTCSIVFRKL